MGFGGDEVYFRGHEAECCEPNHENLPWLAQVGRALNVLSAAHLDIDDTATRTGPTAGWIIFRSQCQFG